MKKLALLATTSVLALGIATFNNVRAGDPVPDDLSSVKSNHTNGPVALDVEQQTEMVDKFKAKLLTQQAAKVKVEEELDSTKKELETSLKLAKTTETTVTKKKEESVNFAAATTNLAQFNQQLLDTKNAAEKRAQKLSQEIKDLKAEKAQTTAKTKELEVQLSKNQGVVNRLSNLVQSAKDVDSLKLSVAQLVKQVQPEQVASATSSSFVNSTLAANQANNTTTTTRIQVQGDNTGAGEQVSMRSVFGLN